MKTCDICNTYIIRRKKCKNGQICRSCYTNLPEFIKKDIKNTTVEQILGWNEHYTYTHANYIDTFSPTASFGSFYIDEANGLIAICPQNKIKEGKLHESVRDIFNLLNLRKIHFDIDPVEQKGHELYCAIKLTIDFTEINKQYTYLIKRKVSCEKEYVDSEHIQFFPPYSLNMIETIVQRAYEEAVKNYNNEYLLPNDLELYKAKALFMLDDEYTVDDIKGIYKKLIKTFHPDNGETDNKYIQLITKYYRLLCNHKKSIQE